MTSDLLGRPLRDLRISLTDRCNFRCGYCMPRELFGPDHAFLPTSRLLSIDEIERVARTAVELGVSKIRLTGGEPLMRRGVVGIVERLARIEGLDLAMTTNGVLLPRFADDLAAAGLRRVTVSLDAVDQEIFEAASDSRFRVADVLRGVDAADAAGLGPVKVNAVIRRGLTDRQILPMIREHRGSGRILRFIEFMDVGGTNGWSRDHVVTAEEILDLIRSEWQVVELPASRYGEVAQRFMLADGSLEIGIIASVSVPFCGTCTRARVTAEGRLHTCLFSAGGVDLVPALRHGRPGDLEGLLSSTWAGRADRYSELRSGARTTLPVEMSYIGG
ncbi:GTP 3',8-cyclase MoaA [Nocardioides bruguierae]|uniref:GTP 3',8-cyclase n=1 Tax=Nocardioides bruguierae TaxID=2945102 RepID=A0A9X2DB80_9ACTN|nr:GTP 3',8-cyclase MoaA [Nocardioides bruguierae]MCM0622751.1 GTP 3',8-cyclase MoaA [Nocardioides bruguierae]